jgi:hypothetical protein
LKEQYDKLLSTQYDKLLSTFAFKFKLRRYTEGGCPTVSGVAREEVTSVAAAATMVRRASAARAVEAGLGSCPYPPRHPPHFPTLVY